MRKILFSLLLFSIAALILTGCFFPMGDYGRLQSEIDRLEDELSRMQESQTQISWPSYSMPFNSEPSDDVSDQSAPDYSAPDQSVDYSEPASSVVELDTLTEVRDYINSRKEQDIFETEFIYNGDMSKLDGATIARISAACVISYSTAGNKYNVTVIEYPGDRIVDAYFSGDQSKLNSEEKRALKTAVDMVNTARAKAKNDIELEIILHDMLVEKVTYFDGSTDVPDPQNPPRHLTAIGSLLDGVANCQGYTDGFYTLASIAGFKVGRMNVYNSDGWHVLNMVQLGDKWYAVDATFNDCMADGDKYIPSYRLFNAGRDRVLEYQWGAEMEYYPLTNTSDKNYFYYLPEDSSKYGYKKAYTDINAMAQDIVDRWLDKKESIQCVMYVDNVCDWNKLSDAMQYADNRGRQMSWTIWTYTNGRDTFFTVKLS